MKKISARRVTHHRNRVPVSKQPVTFTFQRIVIFGSLVFLFFLTLAVINRRPLTQAVAGVSIVRSLFSQATVYWEPVQNVSTYNVYYKSEGDSDFTHAVRGVPANITYYTISYLRKGVNYEYRVSAADASGKEFWWSGTNRITNLESM